MSIVSDLWSGRANINFTTKWKPAAILSAVLVTVAILSLLIQGLNLGIEFSGGQSWELRSDATTTTELREAIAPLGLGDARIQQVANDTFRVRAEVESAGSSSAAIGEVSRALAESAGIDANQVTTNAVGASWGSDVTSSAVRALIVFAIVVFIYITIRLEWKMALAAVVAVLHDIIVTVGVYALFQFEVTAATVIAFLTILGYSLYDTLIVFDKVRENERRVSTASRLTISGLVSHSLNQVIMRSVNTTITSVIPVLSVLIIGRFILGAVTLQEFAIALLAGLLVGTYSSLFVAAPLLAWLKEREPANQERRQRLGDDADSVDSKIAAQELASADRAREVRAAARQTSRAGTSTVTGRVKAKEALDSSKPSARSSASGTDSGVTKTRSGTPNDGPQDAGAIAPRPRKKKRKS